MKTEVPANPPDMREVAIKLFQATREWLEVATPLKMNERDRHGNDEMPQQRDGLWICRFGIPEYGLSILGFDIENALPVQALRLAIRPEDALNITYSPSFYEADRADSLQPAATSYQISRQSELRYCAVGSSGDISALAWTLSNTNPTVEELQALHAVVKAHPLLNAFSEE